MSLPPTPPSEPPAAGPDGPAPPTAGRRSRPGRLAAVALVLSLLVVGLPGVASAVDWTRFYTSPSSGDPQNTWRSKDMSPTGFYQHARIRTAVSGCGGGGDPRFGEACSYGYLRIPGDLYAQGVAPVTTTFKKRTGIFRCRWSTPGPGKNRMFCDVGAP